VLIGADPGEKLLPYLAQQLALKRRLFTIRRN
jgi:hypothetical protein